MSNFLTKYFRFLSASILLIVVLAFSVYFYFESKIPENRKSGEFSQSINGLKNAKEAEIVTLADGDTFDLIAEYVVKDIGNKHIRMIAYNGSVPGPFIKVKQGGTITINFTNNLDIETTIHSHGLRLDNEFDGVPDITQKAVMPGESFAYKLKFPDAGTYWYHPHVREDYAQELGLYGNYQVTPTEYELPPVNREVNLIVDDILFENDAPPPFLKDKTNFAVMGRFGNVMLVNGRTDFHEEFTAGDVVRMNITNTANARPFELTIPGARMKLIASDLSPYEREEFVDKVFINPSERYVVDVYFEKKGAYELTHESHDRTLGDIKYKMADFIVKEAENKTTYLADFEQLRVYEQVVNDANKFEEYLFKKPDKNLSINLKTGNVDLGSNAMESLPCHRMPDGEWMGQCTEQKKKDWIAGLTSGELAMGGEKIHWEDHIYEVNKNATTQDITWEFIDTSNQNTNQDIDWKFKDGDVKKIRVFNDPNSPHPMQHPFHIHGQRMMAMSVNGEEIENKVWKDSILIPVGDTVDIMVEFSNPGIWMAHCHIAEHLSSGMMFNVAVGEEYFSKYEELIEHRTH